MDGGAISGDQAVIGTEVRAVWNMAATGPVPMNPADPGRMFERQALGALRCECGLEGRASAATVDPIDGARPEAQGGAPRLAGENGGHLRGHGCS